MSRGKKFEFSQEQIDYIINNWGKESAYSMKNKFGCSWYAICNVAKQHGLSMPESDKWTKQQVDELVKMSDKMHYEKIAQILGKTNNAVYLKAKRLNITLIQDRREWTEEEIIFLKEKWGNNSINFIAKKVKHSVNAVKIKAYRLGLGPAVLNTDLLLVSDIVEMLGVSRDRICTTWCNLCLKLKRHKISDKKSYYYIKEKDLIEFLKANQNQWDSRNLELYTFGYEEEWLVEKRNQDRKTNPLWYRRWTIKEKNHAMELLKSGKNYDEIAARTNRTVQAVSYMLRSEGYSYRLNRYWKGQELKFLKDNFEIMKYSDIADSLGRTTKAVSAKAEEMGYQKRYISNQTRKKRGIK